ncbi:MAG: cytoskeletal protein binding protein [Caeruleum heppii]|nr:MAG: cytoskeletal protein binding protein [Caeruleum heppii]
MGFLGVCRAIYDYAPQTDQELAIADGDLLFVLEKSAEDEWWKAKKRAKGEEDDEPVGLIPKNYIEEAQPIHHARALYDYTRQTDEELSFAEEAALIVYDTSDPDWSLVGFNGDYGFVPSNYIELSDNAPDIVENDKAPPTPERSRQSYPTPEPDQPASPSSVDSPAPSPAAALAGIIGRKASSTARRAASPPPMTPARPPNYTPDDSDEEAPSSTAPNLPTRHRSPPSQLASPRTPDASRVVASPPFNRVSHQRDDDDDDGIAQSPRGFHLYNISEMVTAMGKQKKMPTTLGINVAAGTLMISPEKSRDGPQQEWTADRLTYYSQEGKHVFLELVRPSKSADLHAGTKDTANEIVSALGEMAGAAKAEGLREVIAASAGGKSRGKGQMLYDFMAQGDDEVTVAAGDEVVVLDDTKSDDWWMVRRLKNGKEGVVPSSYVEVTGQEAMTSPSASGINAGRSTVEQNRLEEARMTREAARSARGTTREEVGPGMRLPERGSSLMVKSDGPSQSSSRDRRDQKSDGKVPSTTKPRPDSSRIRTWTDRSGSFKVEAEFIGCTDGKIHLHKVNGVKIAVPVVKMSMDDLEYVERITGLSLDEDKPLSDIRRRSQMKAAQSKDRAASTAAHKPSPIAQVEQPQVDEYDWFDFFLKCGVGVHQCERYASNFAKDSMDESSLPDITPSLLRTLGLKEGDILRVMRFLDQKYGRSGGAAGKRNVSFGGAQVIGKDDGETEDGEATGSASGGLFAGPGGTLRNNTRKGRPAPAVQTSSTVDPRAFEPKEKGAPTKENAAARQEERETDSDKPPPPVRKGKGGFEDDAWDVKPGKGQSTTTRSASASEASGRPTTQQPALTDAMKDLSLLSAPLQPVIAHTTGPPQTAQPSQSQPQPQLQPTGPPMQSQPAGATPSFFMNVGQQPTGAAYQQGNATSITPMSSLPPQPTGFSQQQMPPMQSRQRPPAPPQALPQGSLMLPPPPRPLSAPQNVSQQSGFGPPPLQPQLTGFPQGHLSPSLAPPGQSLEELNRMRAQQQFMPNQMSSQPTGFGASNGVSGMMAQQTGLNGLQQPSPYVNGQQVGGAFNNPGQPQPNGGYPPFAMQPTGQPMTMSSPPFQAPQPTGTINTFLPPPLQPQPTGPSGFGGGPLPSGYPPVPPPLPQPAAAPLRPQQTGPAPPVRFGVKNEAKKLQPQATGRRANLSQATPENPFGF